MYYCKYSHKCCDKDVCMKNGNWRYCEYLMIKKVSQVPYEMEQRMDNSQTARPNLMYRIGRK